MANVKITQLPSATTPLTGTEVFPLVQGTTTKQVTITGLFTSPVMSNPTLGVVGQADLINATGLPISSGVAGLGAGIATFLGTPSSANLRTAVTDETGSGALVFANAPVLVAPDLGTPTFLVATNATGTAVGLTAGSAITNANLTGAVTSVGNATSLGSFTSAQLRTALTDETGAGSAVFATSPTITAPILNQINDTNNAQILGLSPTTSAVDYLVVKNGIGVGVPLHFYADGSSANIGLHIQPKGTGLVTISDGTDFNKGIRFRSSSSAASAVTLLDAVSTAGRVVTLPDATTTLVGRDTTDTLTNKTIAFSSNTFSGTLAIANGGTNASTAASAIENLLPAYAGNGSKGLRLNSGATALEWVADGGGTVTSVAATVPSFLSIAGSPITTSGTLAISLSGTALPTTSGGTGLTSFTSGGVVYASSTSALATGSALTFDGTTLTIPQITTTVDANGTNTFGRYSAGYTWSLFRPSVTSTGFEFRTNAGDALYQIDQSSGANKHIWYTSTSGEIMRLTSTSLYTASGINVGIGTSNPAFKLDSTGTSTTALTAFGVTNNSSANNITKTVGVSLRLANTVGFVKEVAYLTAYPDQANTVGGGLTFSTRTADATPTEKMRLDSAGNLGLGIAPSAWNSGYKFLQFSDATGAFVGGSGYSLQLGSNAYINSSSVWVYGGGSYKAARYAQFDGAHTWFSSTASPVTGNDVVFSQAMTLDASGRLGIGTTLPAQKLHIEDAGNLALQISKTGVASFSITNNGASGTVLSVESVPMIFNTSSTERARIDSSGNLTVGTANASGTSGVGCALNPTANGFRAVSAATTSAAETYSMYSTGASAYRFYVDWGGTINATSIVISAISDQRLKENVRDIDTGLNAIMALQPRRFDWKDGKGQDKKNVAGFIAQEFEEVFPECVSTSKAGADGIEYKNINHETLIPTLVKAMQEQQAIIESLKARLDAANL